MLFYVSFFLGVRNNPNKQIFHTDEKHVDGHIQKAEEYRLNAEAYLICSSHNRVVCDVDYTVYPHNDEENNGGVDDICEKGPQLSLGEHHPFVIAAGGDSKEMENVIYEQIVYHSQNNAHNDYHIKSEYEHSEAPEDEEAHCAVKPEFNEQSLDPIGDLVDKSLGAIFLSGIDVSLGIGFFICVYQTVDSRLVYFIRVSAVVFFVGFFTFILHFVNYSSAEISML
jgi:hypothetical protein